MDWSNRIGRRERNPWLLLVNSQIHVFAGESIPGVVAVVGRDYKKDGKWSATTYRLEIATGVRAISGRDGWETGRFSEGLAAIAGQPCDRWAQVASALGVPMGEAQRFLQDWRPRAAEALDAVEAALAAIDVEAAEGAEETVVSFGAPTRRERDSGFWTWPVVVTGHDKREIARIVPGDSDGWATPAVVPTSAPVRVLDCTRTAGHGGGYVSLRLAIPASAVARHGVE